MGEGALSTHIPRREAPQELGDGEQTGSPALIASLDRDWRAFAGEGPSAAPQMVNQIPDCFSFDSPPSCGADNKQPVRQAGK